MYLLQSNRPTCLYMNYIIAWWVLRHVKFHPEFYFSHFATFTFWLRLESTNCMTFLETQAETESNCHLFIQKGVAEYHNNRAFERSIACTWHWSQYWLNFVFKRSGVPIQVYSHSDLGHTCQLAVIPNQMKGVLNCKFHNISLRQIIKNKNKTKTLIGENSQYLEEISGKFFFLI